MTRTGHHAPSLRAARRDLLLVPARESFERFIFAREHRTAPPIMPAQLGSEAGLIGAALLALQRSPRPRGHVVRALTGRITS